MKHLLISAIVLASFQSCTKSQKNCYTCTNTVTQYSNADQSRTIISESSEVVCDIENVDSFEKSRYDQFFNEGFRFFHETKCK